MTNNGRWTMLSDGIPLVCNIAAIPADRRPRYNDLIARLRQALRQLSELSDGYAYELDMERISLLETAEWITMERLCCPFLSFHLDLYQDRTSRLTLRGPDGTKSILQLEFNKESY